MINQPTNRFFHPSALRPHPSSGRDLALLIAQRLNDPSFNGETELWRIFLLTEVQ